MSLSRTQVQTELANWVTGRYNSNTLEGQINSFYFRGCQNYYCWRRELELEGLLWQDLNLRLGSPFYS